MICQAGDVKVTAEDYETAVKAALWMDRDSSAPTVAEAEDAVVKLLFSRVLQREADRQGAAADPDYQAALRYRTTMQLAEMAGPAMAYDVFTPEPTSEEAERLYEFYRNLAYIPQVRYNFIFLRTAGLNAEERAAKRQLADKIRQRVTTGKEDFHKVLMETSEAATKSPENIMLTPDLKNLDPRMWDTLAAMKPLSVSEVIDTAAGFYIFYMDRTTVMRPDVKFSGYDLGEVDKFYFSQMFKAPVNKYFLEYQVKTPVYLHSPSDPMPARDAVLVEVGSQRLTLGDLQAAMKLAGQPELTKPDLIKATWNSVQLMTWAEKVRRHGLEAITSGSLKTAEATIAINQRWLRNKALEAKAEPAAGQLKQYWEEWRKSNGRVPIVGGWRLVLKPAGNGGASPIEAAEEIGEIRKRLDAGETVDKLVAGYSDPRFKLEAQRQEPAILPALRATTPAWPEEPMSGGKPVYSVPSRLADGYALYVVSERQPAEEWKFEPLEPMLKEMWRQDQALLALRTLEQNMRNQLVIDREQLQLTDAQMKELAATLPPPIK